MGPDLLNVCPIFRAYFNSTSLSFFVFFKVCIPIKFRFCQIPSFPQHVYCLFAHVPNSISSKQHSICFYTKNLHDFFLPTSQDTKKGVYVRAKTSFKISRTYLLYR